MQLLSEMRAVHKTSDKDIFTELKGDVIQLCNLLLEMRSFAMELGNMEDVKKIDLNIAENKQILSLINAELEELAKKEDGKRMGLFDTIWAA